MALPEIREIKNDSELDKLLNRDFTFSLRSGYVEVGEDNYCLPIYYKEYAEKIRNFRVRDDDVFLVAHPKTGTVWSQEMIWLIVNNLDYETALNTLQYHRFPQIEFCSLFELNENSFNDENVVNMLENLEKSKSPRCMKTHLAWSLLPEDITSGRKKPKIISVLRNAEDVCVSLYHHSKLFEGYKGTFETFCELFLGGRVCFGPFWKQVLSCWEHRQDDNILFIKYAEMKRDLPAVIARVANFLGKSLNQDEIQVLAKHLSFESMKQNKMVNLESAIEWIQKNDLSDSKSRFMRKGEVGSHLTEMTPELIERFKIWNEENLRGIDLSFE